MTTKILVAALLLGTGTLTAADQKAVLGPFTCSVPGDWLLQASPPNMVRYAAPRSFQLDASTVQVMLIIGEGPTKSKDLEDFTGAIKPQLDRDAEKLKRLVGKASTGTKKLTNEDLSKPTAEIVNKKNQKLLRVEDLIVRESKGESLVISTISFHQVNAKKHRWIGISGPKGLMDHYREEIKNMVASIEYKKAEQGVEPDAGDAPE